MDKRFYIYVYMDQRKPGKWVYGKITFDFQPFYVGKGTGRRDVMHLCPYMLNQKTYKTSTIKSIVKDTGEIPLHRRIFENLKQPDAVTIEMDFIKTFGRKDNGTGILCNHTDGGDGSNNMASSSRHRIAIAHRKSIYQYSLSGRFLKKWKSLMDAEHELQINVANIPTSVTRGGTSNGFIWSYKYLGKKIPPRIQYQMPSKHNNIKQISLETGEVIRVHPNIASILKEFDCPHQNRNYILSCLNGKTKSAMGYYWTTDDCVELPTKQNARVVCQYATDGVLMNEHKSLSDAERKTGVPFRQIWDACNGKCKTAGTFVWRYKNE
jgi:hypothetical protein